MKIEDFAILCIVTIFVLGFIIEKIIERITKKKRNLARENLAREMIAHVNMMWDLFSRVVSTDENAKIERFLYCKDKIHSLIIKIMD